jgi:hypothetical protein
MLAHLLHGYLDRLFFFFIQAFYLPQVIRVRVPYDLPEPYLACQVLGETSLERDDLARLKSPVRFDNDLGSELYRFLFVAGNRAYLPELP